MTTDPYDVNCTHCVQAFELRRRGVDVEATGLPDALLPSLRGAGGRVLADIERAWGITFEPGSPDDIRAAFRRHGPGSRGFVAVLWRIGGGHTFSVENVGGSIRFMDPQTGQADVGHYLDLAFWAAFARVDTAPAGSGVLEFAARPDDDGGVSP